MLFRATRRQPTYTGKYSVHIESSSISSLNKSVYLTHLILTPCPVSTVTTTLSTPHRSLARRWALVVLLSTVFSAGTLLHTGFCANWVVATLPIWRSSRLVLPRPSGPVISLPPRFGEWAMFKMAMRRSDLWLRTTRIALCWAMAVVCWRWQAWRASCDYNYLHQSSIRLHVVCFPK